MTRNADEQEAVWKNPSVELHSGGVFILVTSVQGSLIAAVHTTRESAMAAAVGGVEGEAETRLSGSLEERYEKARCHVEGQGGQMEITKSLLFGQAQWSPMTVEQQGIQTE
jgi:hypothetical protein